MKAEDANPIDIHVGRMVRLRRQQLGYSQTTVADAVGLTFQQIQKYERGSNRISASKLYEIATVFKTRIDWFFDGLPNPQRGEDTPAFGENAAAFCRAGVLVPAIAKLPDLPPDDRNAIARLIERLPTADEITQNTT